MKTDGLTFRAAGARSSQGFTIDELCSGCLHVLLVGSAYAEED